jgi:hypothetical protein
MPNRNAFSPFVKQFGQSHMRWFGAAFLFFKHVGDVVPGSALKLVFLLLGIPCFEISHLCFKRAYAIQLRRIRLASSDTVVQGVEDRLLDANSGSTAPAISKRRPSPTVGWSGCRS